MSVTVVVLLILGLVLLVGGAEFLVRGASRIALLVGISPLVVGLTVVAFGTSAPELAVSVVSSYKSGGDLALGNVIGSNVFNILVILGLSAVIIPLVVAQQLVRFDVPVMIGISVLLYLMGMDGVISRLDGVFLAAGVIAYTLFLIYQSRKEKNAEVKAEYDLEFGEEEKPGGWGINLMWVVLGMAGLILGSKWLVDGAVEIARAFNVSELVIGLTIVAMGTSLPEVATSVVAAVKGERDIAVGNAVGSNIFNILCVIGFSSLFAPAGIAVSDRALEFDLPIMIAVAVISLPIFFSYYRITRANGAMFLIYYLAYLIYTILHSTNHAWFDTYHAIMIWIMLPVVVVSLVLEIVRGIRAKLESKSLEVQEES